MIAVALELRSARVGCLPVSFDSFSDAAHTQAVILAAPAPGVRTRRGVRAAGPLGWHLLLGRLRSLSQKERSIRDGALLPRP